MIRFLSSDEFDKDITGPCEIRVEESGDTFDGNFHRCPDEGDIFIEVPDIDEVEGNKVVLILTDGNNSTYSGTVKDGSLTS